MAIKDLYDYSCMKLPPAMLGLSDAAPKVASTRYTFPGGVSYNSGKSYMRGFTGLEVAMGSWFQVSCTWYGSRVAVHSMVPG